MKTAKEIKEISAEAQNKLKEKSAADVDNVVLQILNSAEETARSTGNTMLEVRLDTKQKDYAIDRYNLELVKNKLTKLGFTILSLPGAKSPIRGFVLSWYKG